MAWPVAGVRCEGRGRPGWEGWLRTLAFLLRAKTSSLAGRGKGTQLDWLSTHPTTNHTEASRSGDLHVSKDPSWVLDSPRGLQRGSKMGRQDPLSAAGSTLCLGELRAFPTHLQPLRWWQTQRQRGRPGTS